jgi:hypothetical protein
MDALALVEAARVVVGDGALHGLGELDASLLDEVVDQLDAEHDLELVVLAIARIVLGKGDVVVRVGSDDPLGSYRAPVGDVVVRVPAGELDVAHLGGGPAAAPPLAHEAELDARLLEQLGESARVRRPVERGLAVDEEDRLAADRDVEALRPVGHVLLADRHVAQHGLVVAIGEALVPDLPALALVARFDHQRAHRLDDVHRARAVPVEVAGEERVRAAQLARAALRAVHVVVGDVLHADQALLHRDDVRVERGRGVVLVARDLHDGADLATELVPGREAPVSVGAPLLHERFGQVAITVRVVAVAALVETRLSVRHALLLSRRLCSGIVPVAPSRISPVKPFVCPPEKE